MQSAIFTSPKPIPSMCRTRSYTQAMTKRKSAAPTPARGHSHQGSWSSQIMSGRPMAATGRMTTSGMIWISRSTWLTRIMAATKSRCGTSHHERPS